MPLASDASTITSAVRADEDNLDVVKWLRKKGCDWNDDTCYMAARKGHGDILAYLRENGCPWDDRCGYTKCRAWAMAHGIEGAKGYSGDFDEYASDSESSDGSSGAESTESDEFAYYNDEYTYTGNRACSAHNSLCHEERKETQHKQTNATAEDAIV